MGGLMDWYNANSGFGKYAIGSGLAGRTGSGLGNFASQQQQMANTYGTAYGQIYLNPQTGSTNVATIDYNNVYSSEAFQKYIEMAQDKVVDSVKKVAKKIQKTGHVLLDLRREIDEWHGDILRLA